MLEIDSTSVHQKTLLDSAIYFIFIFNAMCYHVNHTKFYLKISVFDFIISYMNMF